MTSPFNDPAELLTQVSDDDAEVLGPVERRRVHGDPALIHRAAHVLVLHPDTGLLLLQKRSALKDTHPGKWDTSVGGHVGFGQSYEEAALRETEEELGLKIAASQLEKLYLSRCRYETESENTATFLCVHAGPFEFNPEEITEIKFWSRAGIQAALGSGVFTPNFEQEFATFLACPRGPLLR
jgi:isopentenyldiphosphate isomerase